MNSEFKIKSTQGAAVIRPTHDMGGGIDGYYMLAKNEANENVLSKCFTTPYYSTPEEEWKVFSDIGKESIRSEGWDKVRTLDEVMVYTLEYIHFTEEDASQLEADYREKENIVSSKMQQGLKSIETFDPGALRAEVSELQSIRKVLKVWETKGEILRKREETYGSFIIPKD